MTEQQSRSTPFLWHVVDVRAMLPEHGLEAIEALAHTQAQPHDLTPTSVTSREDAHTLAVPVLTVGGETVVDDLPWLAALYHDEFRKLAERIFNQRVHVAADPRYAINLNVQHGGGRYEAHVDSNPIEGLLYATTHPPGCGGELAVSNRGDVTGIDQIERDASRIFPVAGHMVFFDARRHSHYVAPLRDPSEHRVVVAMNFYTDEAPESERPPDLTNHLFYGERRQKEGQPA